MKRLKRHPETRSVFSKALALATLILIVTGATLFVLAFYTDTCRIKNVVVKGSNNLDASYVRLESGVDSYKNLITLPVGRVENNLKQDPWIEDVRISRKLLNTVCIVIRERQPIAVIDFGSSGLLVDGQGFVIKKVEPAEYKSLARINGGDTSIPVIGCEVEEGKIKDSITAIENMHVELREYITAANPFDGRGQVFACSLGFQIIYGTGSDASKKNDVLEAIMLDIKNNHRKVAYLDLRVPDSPVIKPD